MSIELVPETTHVAPGDALRFVLVNPGPGQISFGQVYHVQREQAGEWVDANVEQPWVAFTMEARTMRPGGTFAQSMTLRDDVPPGRYRVSKGVLTEDSGAVTVSFEFEVGYSAGTR
jgi:hypothetical protein